MFKKMLAGSIAGALLMAAACAYFFSFLWLVDMFGGWGVVCFLILTGMMFGAIMGIEDEEELVEDKSN